MDVVNNFKSNVLPHLKDLESGPIHGDFNEQNILGQFVFDNSWIICIERRVYNSFSFHSKFFILVKLDENHPEKDHICGILDFGDVQYNYYVFEIAIAICYMMLESKSMDILDAPGHVLAGYNHLRTIPEKEFALLKVFISNVHFKKEKSSNLMSFQDCISARFCQSLVLGAYSYSQNPDPYLLITSQRGWQCLQILWECSSDELYKRWRSIMQIYLPDVNESLN